MGTVHAANLGYFTFRVFLAYARLMGLNIRRLPGRTRLAEDGAVAAHRNVPDRSHSDGAQVSQVWRHMA